MPEKLWLGYISKRKFISFEEKAIKVYYSNTAPAGGVGGGSAFVCSLKHTAYYLR